MSKPDSTKKKAYGSIIAIVLLFFMLVLTTYALVLSMVSVDGNLFEMGTVEIELNGGETIFDGSDMNIEPGHSVRKDFTVENNGTADVYYRLYLENITGSMKRSLNFEIYEGDKLLFSGNAEELSKETPCVSNTPLAAGETKILTAVVKMYEKAGNGFQSSSVSFDITADAVQAKNNPDKAFE